MNLKYNIETYIQVEYHDLDDFITWYFSFEREKESMDKFREEPKDGIYLKRFEFVAIEEANNDSAYTYHVTGDKDYDWDEKEMKEMMEAKDFDNYSTRRILDYLASKDVIPKGTYLINVSW